jgi:hypothetical protein
MADQALGELPRKQSPAQSSTDCYGLAWPVGRYGKEKKAALPGEDVA